MLNKYPYFNIGIFNDNTQEEVMIIARRYGVTVTKSDLNLLQYKCIARDKLLTFLIGYLKEKEGNKVKTSARKRTLYFNMEFYRQLSKIKTG